MAGGEAICRKQSEQGWGKAVVETLARDLQVEFPGRNGFSAQNLWLMRQFFNEYSDKPNPTAGWRNQAGPKICSSWPAARTAWSASFICATARFGWTKNVLQHQLDNQSTP